MPRKKEAKEANQNAELVLNVKIICSFTLLVYCPSYQGNLTQNLSTYNCRAEQLWSFYYKSRLPSLKFVKKFYKKPQVLKSSPYLYKLKLNAMYAILLKIFKLLLNIIPTLKMW